MLSLITAALGLLKSLLGMKSDSDANKAGQDAQRAANSQADIDAIKRANIAARKAEDDPDAFDPNDRSTRH